MECIQFKCTFSLPECKQDPSYTIFCLPKSCLYYHTEPFCTQQKYYLNLNKGEMYTAYKYTVNGPNWPLFSHL